MPLPKRMVKRRESRGEIGAIPPVNCPADWRERTHGRRKRAHTAVGMVSRTYGGIRPSVIGKDQAPLAVADHPPLFPEVSQVRAGLILALVEMPRLQKSRESKKQGFSVHRSRPRQTRPLCNEQKRDFVVLESHGRRDRFKEGRIPSAKMGCSLEDFALSMKTKRRPGLNQFFRPRFVNRSIPRRFSLLRRLPQRETNLSDGLVFARTRKATALSPANEEMKDNVLIRGVTGMPVVFPVPYVRIDLDVPCEFHTIDKHLSAAEIRTWLTVPNPKMGYFHFLSVFAQPRNTELSAENSCLQLQLGDATGSGFAQPESSKRPSQLLIRRFSCRIHLRTGVAPGGSAHLQASRLSTARTLNRKRQSIVSQTDILRQRQFGFGVSKIMAHMREKRSARRDAVGGLDSLSQRHVRHMRSVPQRIDHQRINSARRLLGVLSNLFAVGKVS